jgi:autotransporter-associated beta strand protein
MKLFASICCSLLVAATTGRAASMAIDSLTGPVTQNEISSFKTYMLTQMPDPTPWGALNGTGHNAWGDGGSGNALEAFGLMYETTGDIQILTNMIHWTDICVSERNDLMAATNGGQRVMWTNGIAKVWAPNAPTSTYPTYAGGENGDTKAHIAYTALLILQNSALWNQTVPDGNPFGYGVTYFQRATNYIGKCDEGHDGYDYIFYTSTNVIRNPPGWPSGFHTMEANNIQMMLLGYLERLAQCHEILGDNPARLAKYEAIVKAAMSESINGMANCHPGTTNGHAVYAWCYYPWSVYPNNLENVGHAAYDMVGVYRAFNRVSYGFRLSLVKPFGTAEAYVMNIGSNTFSAWVNGTGTTQNYMQAQWLMLADWEPAVWDITAPANLASGRYKTTTLMDATMLWMKNRRYQQFSVTPTPASRTVSIGGGTNFTVTVTPLGGVTNAVSLSVSGLPTGATRTFNSPNVNLAALNYVSTNVTLSVTTSGSTPAGIYPLTITSSNGIVVHTNTVTLVVVSFSLSAVPSSQTVPAGGNTSYTITLSTNAGFSGSVSFGVTGLPANTSAGFNPSSLSGAGNSTLTVNTAANAPSGNYTLTINGTNGAVIASVSVNLSVLGATPIWNGGSSSDSYWNDATNWSGNGITAGSSLIFSGNVRLNNTNDTATGTIYSNLVFHPGAGAFTLNGNPILLATSVTNNSSAPQTVGVGINFSNSITLNGASSPLLMTGGLTNTFGAPGTTRLMLEGTGTLKNLFASTTSPGGTNLIVIDDPAANWTLTGNTASSVPWILALTNGIFNFGDDTNAPTLTLSGTQGVPLDHQIGMASGGTCVFNMNNGTLTTSVRLNTATVLNSTGIINQAGGIMNIGSQFQGANGSSTGEASLVNLSGGTMNINGGSGQFYVASRGNGTLTVDGTAVLNCGTLDVSRNANGNSIGSAGIVNLNGGTLLCNRIGTSTSAAQTNWLHGSAATFNFNGGTLVAKTSATNFIFGNTLLPTIPITAIVQEGGAVIDDGGNAITVVEPLQHDATLAGDADGGLTKLGAGTLTLMAISSYNGDTIISNGVLALSGNAAISNSDSILVNSGAILDASVQTGGALSVAAGQTLTGNSGVKGNITIGNGATLAPGGSLSTLTFSNNLTLDGGSTTIFEVSKAPVTNDFARVTGNFMLGGTIVITNVGAAPYAPGDSFHLFSAGSYSGAFTNIQPVIPAVNLAWNTNNLSGGILSIVSAPTPSPQITCAVMTDGNFIFSATNGVPNWPCYILSATNLSSPMNQWAIIATNLFDVNGGFNFTNSSDSSPSQLFYLLQLQ